MCRDCGCSERVGLAHDHGHGHAGHRHSHSHDHGNGLEDREGRILSIQRSLTERNDHLALHNRERFRAAGTLAINLMSSPGAGKTRLLERTLKDLAGSIRCAVIVGDLATENDAARLRASGAPIVPVTTGTMCHLEAAMIGRACDRLDLDSLDVLFIENVGNLVCPASFDLGEELRVVLMSVTEGEDKPLKYPPMFKSADTILLTKMDLAGAAEFDRVAAVENVRQIAPQGELIELSARTGEGLERWYEALKRKRPAERVSAP